MSQKHKLKQITMKKSKKSQIKKKKSYPITDEHRRHYVRYPIQVTPKMVGIHLIRKEHVGKWVCAVRYRKGVSERMRYS